MDARDICAIGDVLADGLDGTTKRVEEIHEAVARRSFAAAGPVGTLPEAIHDRITRRIYGTVRTLGPAAIRSSALGLGAAVDPAAPRAGRSPRGKTVLSAANAVLGESLARRGNGMSIRMTVRSEGQDLVLTEEALGARLPDATGRIAVFVHGFGESDDSWQWFSHESWGAGGLSYGELLRRDAGYTPLYLHYNSGRSLGVNAAELSDLLDMLVTSWPVWPEQVLLVGHSAGGDLLRSAVRHGALRNAAWTAHVRQVVTLGTPYRAQTAERLAGSATRLLSRLPETRPLAELIESRPAGLKDLGPPGEEVDLPGGVDGIVLTSERLGVGHFRLLNHPLVYREIAARLNDRTALDRAPAAREGRYVRAATALRARRRSQRR